MKTNRDRRQRFLLATSSDEDMRGGGAVQGPAVACPKPRLLSRAARLDISRPALCKACHKQTETETCYHSKASTELLDLFLNKDGDWNQIASSPPFFCGSPPMRTRNPLINDPRFLQEGEAIAAAFMPIPVRSTPSSSINPPFSASSRKGCAAPTKLSFKPAATRIEGFDCLSRDHRGCGIPANA